MDMNDWLSAASAVANVITGIAVVVAAVIYQRQLKVMTKARELESLIVVMNYADNITLRRARYFMFRHGESLLPLLQTPYSADVRDATEALVRELSSGTVDLHEIDLAVNALNNVCFLIREAYAPPAAQALMKNSLLHAWRAFKPYVAHRRTRPDTTGTLTQYAVHFERVVSNMGHDDIGADVACLSKPAV